MDISFLKFFNPNGNKLKFRVPQGLKDLWFLDISFREMEFLHQNWKSLSRTLLIQNNQKWWKYL